MTVENPNQIDIIAGREDPPLVRLVVSDHLDWSAETDHLATLQEKLNHYMAFVETGELVAKYPQYANHPVEVEVVFLHPPTVRVVEHFLDRAAEVVGSAGLEFSWRVGHAS